MIFLLTSLLLITTVRARCYIGFQEIATKRTLYTNCLDSESKDLINLKNIEPFGQIKLLDLQSFSGSFEEDTFTPFKQVDTLQIHESNFGNLTNGVLKKLPLLNKIILRNNRHDGFNQDLFNGLNKLEQIIINNDNIIKLESNLLTGLDNLKALIINSSHIETIHENAFSDQKKLKLLELHSNNLTEIKPKTFDNLASLQTLTLLNNNNLIELPDDVLSKLTNLQALGLPTKVFKQIGVDKLKKMLPKLGTIFVKTQDENCYRDFLKEAEAKGLKIYLVTFASEIFCTKPE